MITTPFGRKECIEHNSEPVAVMRGITRITELKYDIFSRLAQVGGHRAPVVPQARIPGQAGGVDEQLPDGGCRRSRRNTCRQPNPWPGSPPIRATAWLLPSASVGRHTLKHPEHPT